MKKRVALFIEYDGTNYSGWQRQSNASSVQQKIEEAIYKLTKNKVPLISSGRTDAGVHALCQVAHVDVTTPIPGERLSFALNTILPKDIRIIQSKEVSNTFHAQAEATAKWYRYKLYKRKQDGALLRNYAYRVPYRFDIPKMKQALGDILGHHDFKAFMASGSRVITTDRTIYAAQLEEKDNFIDIDIIGNGFLYHMVRIIAGTLVDIGRDQLPKDTFQMMLQSKDRLKGGDTAPSRGLYLMHVYYDKNIEQIDFAKQIENHRL